MDREIWLAKRRSAITGTDICAILGLHPYISATRVWQTKLGLCDEVEENEAMYWGKVLEASIGEHYAKKHGIAILPGRYTEKMHDGVIFAATPDFEISDTKGLEIKTCHPFAKDWGDGPTDIPTQYYTQCQWYMYVTNRTHWDLAVLVGGQKYREYQLTRSDALIRVMQTAGVKFWTEHVAPKNPPPADATRDYRDMIDKYVPSHSTDAIAADGDAEILAGELSAKKTLVTRLATEVAALENKLLQKLQENCASKMIGQCWSLSWTQSQGRKKIEYGRLIDDLNISKKELQKYETTGAPYRTLRFKWRDSD